MLNIIIGIIFIIGGLSGQLVFKGTSSGGLLAVVGVVLVIWGAYRLSQKRKT
jgi:C4-dicarboxylate transporter